jgi:hypothetical protein
MSRGCLLATLLILVLAQPAWPASIVISNGDGAGEGINDPNPPPFANQKGNNPGSTLGEMRLNVFNAVAAHWGGLLNSDVTITVNAQFNSLQCSALSGVLGSASAVSTASNFGAGLPNIVYHIALAESLADTNLNGGAAELTAQFNSELDAGDPDCLGGGGFYYGLDGNAPEGTTPLFTVVLHELSHALGFTHFADVGPGGSGAWTGTGGFPDAFSRNLFDLETGESWSEMVNAERLASAINSPDLVWTGTNVTASRPQFLSPAPELQINAPGAIVGTHPAVRGDEPDAVIPPGGATGNLFDGNALVGDPCNDIPAGVANELVLYDLPAQQDCIAVIPAFLAELGGAAGVVIRNTAASGLPDISGVISNQDVTIPYVGVEQSVGDALRANIGTANATIQESDTVFSGDNQGMLRMYAPAGFMAGSSVSHWANEATPDLLMEPVRGSLAYDQVDITVAAMADIGWSVNYPDGDPILIFEDGFED